MRRRTRASCCGARCCARLSKPSSMPWPWVLVSQCQSWAPGSQRLPARPSASFQSRRANCGPTASRCCQYSVRSLSSPHNSSRSGSKSGSSVSQPKSSGSGCATAARQVATRAVAASASPRHRVRATSCIQSVSSASTRSLRRSTRTSMSVPPVNSWRKAWVMSPQVSPVGVKLKSLSENQPMAASGPLPTPASSRFFLTVRASGGHHRSGALSNWPWVLNTRGWPSGL